MISFTLTVPKSLFTNYHMNMKNHFKYLTTADYLLVLRMENKIIIVIDFKTHVKIYFVVLIYR